MEYPNFVAGVDGGLCTGLGAIISVADKADSAFRAGATAPERVAVYAADLRRRARRCPARAHIGRSRFDRSTRPYRPKGWDLEVNRIRDDLAEQDLAALERQFPGLAARLAIIAQPSHLSPSDNGVQSPHPMSDALNAPTDNAAGRVQLPHPAARTGCWPRACRPPNCPRRQGGLRPGRVVRRMRRAHADARL